MFKYPVVLFACLTFSSSIFAISDTTEWALQRDKNNIKIYTRSIPGYAFKEIKTEFVVNSTLGGLVDLISDTPGSVKWIYNTKSAVKLPNSNRWKGYTYTVTSAPFPLSDRDVVASYELYQNPKSGEIRMDLRAVKNLVPPTSYVRVPEMFAYWRFVPLADGKVKVNYIAYTDPGGYIPANLANLIIVEIPYQSMLRFKMLLEKDGRNKVLLSDILEP